MTKPYFKLPAICVIILSIFNVNAQEIRNLSFSVQGNSVEITFDLQDPKVNDLDKPIRATFENLSIHSKAM